MDKIDELVVCQLSSRTWDKDWQKIKKKCNYLSDWGIAVLSEGLKGTVKSIIVEHNYVCKDHRNLFSNYYSKKFDVGTPYTDRLHFFSKTIDNVTEFLLDYKKFINSYIGFTVIRPIGERCLGRSIFDPSKLASVKQDNLYYLKTKFLSHISGRKFDITGYPYISQTGDVTVCAHSALWGVCRYLSERFPIYKETYPFDLVKLTESTSGRTFPYRGMTYTDYCKILSDFGAFPFLLVMKKKIDDPTLDGEKFRDLCAYVESGFPILASLPRHVIALIGHTIDHNRAVTVDRDGFISSTDYLKQFVVVDDNFFPYRLLGFQGDTENYSDQYNIDDFKTAVCPLPEKVFMQASDARYKVMQYFKGMRRSLESMGNGPYVIRLFLATNPSFKRRKLEHILNGRTHDTFNYIVSQLNLPHFVWIAEAAPIDLYKSGYCTSEVVIDATCNAAEDSLIYMRTGNSFRIEGQNIELASNPIQFAQFTHNLGEK